METELRMKAETLIPAVILTLVISLNSALALGGATVPWTTYEAENMTTTGTILGPSYAGNNVASESSGRQCVQFNATGQYLQFTAQSNANAIVCATVCPILRMGSEPITPSVSTKMGYSLANWR